MSNGWSRVNFFRYSQIQVTVCANGKEKSKLPVEAQLFCRRFDRPAFQLTRRKPDRPIASQLNLYGSAVNVRFQNPATPQPLRPLRFQKRTFTATLPDVCESELLP